MKVKFRRSNNDDLENIYQLQIKSFNKNDQWYKSIIQQYLNNGIVIETENNIIGVLLQGQINACDGDEIFDPINEIGEDFVRKNLHIKKLNGIVMLCIDPEYQRKGLGQKLINKHLEDNKNNLVCLFTRKTNIKAYNLYVKLGYEHIGYIKNKYFQPNEDGIFMINKI